ncbi:hypothetical protein JOD24_001729 [Kroppenstedtia sanguinis]
MQKLKTSRDRERPKRQKERNAGRMRRPAFRSGWTNGFPPVCHGRSDRNHNSHRGCWEDGHGVEHHHWLKCPAHLKTTPLIPGPATDVHPAFKAG